MYRATNISEKGINVRGTHRKSLGAAFHARQGRHAASARQAWTVQ